MTALAEKSKNPPADKKVLPGRDYPSYAPRFWHGMRLLDWLRLANENRWRMHPARWGMAFMVTNFAAGNSVLGSLQNLIHGRAIQNVKLQGPPVFIIGHWRSGTTYLHELMTRDERFATPTSFQCFQPHHMLLTEWLVTRLFWWMVPSKRPMDNVDLGWNSPQEDEFALCALGLPTPYRRMAFPNGPPVDMNYLDMTDLSHAEKTRWTDTLDRFVRLITYHTNRRVLLKSPPHTGRLEVLAEKYPGAKFIHLVRDPYSLFSSTVKLWRTLNYAQGFQLSEGVDLEDYVYTCLERMYQGLHEQRKKVDPSVVYDVKYEDLVRDPVGQLRTAYEKLDLGGFDEVEPKLAEYAESKRDYQPNRHRLEEATRSETARRWGFYFDRYGYEK